MSDETPASPDCLRDLQRAIPGGESLYRLALAAIESALPEGGHILVVGAGGGREIEALSESDIPYQVTAVDPSAERLDLARWQADRLGMPDRVTFVDGTTEDVEAPERGFDAATSMLVMQSLPDDGSKSAYLRSIRERLSTGTVLVHADVSFESEEEFQSMVPIFRRHAKLASVPDEVADTDLGRIPTMPVIGRKRTVELLTEAGFGASREVFRGLWYRGWISVA